MSENNPPRSRACSPFPPGSGGRGLAYGGLQPTQTTALHILDLRIDVVRKDIKNLHLAVCPSHGRIRIAVPHRLDDETIRLAIISRLRWIRRQQANFTRQDRQSARDMVTGESHYVAGRRYRLDVIEHQGVPSVRIRDNATLELRIPPGTDRIARQTVLHRWYRRQLRTAIAALIVKWQPILGVEVAAWGIKKMKTRWGTCTIPARRIWLNLELAKKPPACLEYILVHEMVHLLEHHHTDRFRTLMDHHLPHWPLHRADLNRAPPRPRSLDLLTWGVRQRSRRCGTSSRQGRGGPRALRGRGRGLPLGIGVLIRPGRHGALPYHRLHQPLDRNTSSDTIPSKRSPVLG